MAKVVGKRPDGVVLVEVPVDDAHDLEIGADVEVRRAADSETESWPDPFGRLAGQVPEIGIEDVKAARRDALLGKTR